MISYLSYAYEDYIDQSHNCVIKHNLCYHGIVHIKNYRNDAGPKNRGGSIDRLEN